MIPKIAAPTRYIAILCLMLILGLSACQDSSAPPSARDGGTAVDAMAEKEAIRGVLMRQQEAWNAGDIETFMADYVRSDTLRFTSGGDVRYGWDSAMERYLATYPDRGAMGVLRFSDLAIDVLSQEWALVFGSWDLERGGDYEDIGGKYTLLMHRGSEGWKVVYDHTSQVGQ